MRHIGGGRRVGRRTHAGLIGVQAALDAPHDAGAGEAAENGLEIKGGAEDHAEHAGETGDVHDHDDQGDDNVQDAHQGDEHFGYPGKTSAAAEDADPKQDGENGADHIGGSGVIEGKAAEGVLGVIRCKHVIPDHIGENQDNGKDHTEPALSEGILHVVGGSAVAASVAVAFFIDLCQGRFHKGRGPAEDGRDPHPENGAGTAKAERGGDTHDIAGSDTGGGRDHQRAEGRGCAEIDRLLLYDANGFPEKAKLQKPGSNREVDPCQHKKQGDDIGLVKDPADGVDDIVNGIDHDFTSLFCGWGYDFL